jgi:hypothetical protein
MSDKVVTEQPKHDEKLLSAVESTLRAHDLRLKPGEDCATVVDSLAQRGIKLTATNGYLNASQNVAGADAPMHVNQIFEGLASQEPQRFFPREVSGVKSRGELDQAGKMKFIKEQGLSAWEKLPQNAPKTVTVVLDKNKLKKAEYLSLDRKTRSELAGLWGADAIAKVMSRK